MQFTKVSPTTASAPNTTGTATQISCVIVKEQEPFFIPGHGMFPDLTTGSPQHVVTVVPACAKGVTDTGTQIEAF